MAAEDATHTPGVLRRTAAHNTPGSMWGGASMSERVKSQSAGPKSPDVFKSDTEHGYLEGYEGAEIEEQPESRGDFAASADWGRQGEWGTFSNRPGWKDDREWAESAAAEAAESENASQKP